MNGMFQIKIHNSHIALVGWVGPCMMGSMFTSPKAVIDELHEIVEKHAGNVYMNTEIPVNHEPKESHLDYMLQLYDVQQEIEFILKYSK